MLINPRKKKCDQLYPICSHCLRLNLVCKREPPRSVLPSPGAATGGSEVTETRVVRTPSIDQQIKEVTQLCQPLGLSLEPGDANSKNLVGSRRVMLRYYTVTLAFLLTTNLENNCFLSGMCTEH